MNPLDPKAADATTTRAGFAAPNRTNLPSSYVTGSINNANPSTSQTDFMIELLALMQLEQEQSTLSNAGLSATSSGLSSASGLLANPSIAGNLSPTTAEWLAMTMESALPWPGITGTAGLTGSTGFTGGAGLIGSTGLTGSLANPLTAAQAGSNASSVLASLLASELSGSSALGLGGNPSTGALANPASTYGAPSPFPPSSYNPVSNLPTSESIPAIPTSYLNPSDPLDFQVQQAVSAASAKYGVPSSLIRGVIEQESGMNPNAVSSAGAMGLMQLMPNTAKEMGLSNPFDVVGNIDAGTRYLGTLINRYNGDVPLALAAYNAGPGAVEEYGGVPPYPQTQNYVSRVLSYSRSYAAGSL